LSERKHLRYVLAYAFTHVLHITHHIKCTLFCCLVKVGHILIVSLLLKFLLDDSSVKMKHFGERML